jgi:lysophospholipase L1-like esterase
MPAWSWVHEIVVLSASATAEHHALVAAWLEWHLSTPVVACALDSLTTGYVLSTQGSLVYRLARNYWRGCVSVPSLGIPGQQVTAALVGDSARLAAVKGRGRNILVLQGGSNDIDGGAPKETVWSLLKAYRDLAEAEGFDVVLCTIPESPYWSLPQVNKMSEVVGLNDMMAAEWQASGFAAFVDIGAPNSLDGLHFSSAGVNAVVALVGPATDSLL